MYNIAIAKADTTLEVDFDALPEASQTYIIDYGIRQILNDATASVAKDEPNCAALAMSKVQKKMEALASGTVRVAGTRIGDPIKADAIELAIEMTVRGQFKKAGKALDAKAMRAAAIELVGRNPAYLHIAQKRADDLALEMGMLNAQVGDEELKALEPKAA